MVSQFHQMCGVNVSLDNTRTNALWQPRQSLGFVVVCQSLQDGETLQLDLTESGEVVLGFVQTDPRRLTENITTSLTECPQFKFISCVTVHHKLHTLVLKLESTERETRLTYDDTNKTYTAVAETGKQVWIAMEIKYGRVHVQLSPGDDEQPNLACSKVSMSSLRFDSKTAGRNVELCSEGTIARLIDPNPATTCCLDQPLRPGGHVQFEIEPITVGRNIPSRFYVKVIVSTLKPEERHPELFFGTSKSDNRQDVRHVAILDVNDCCGTVRVGLLETGNRLRIVGRKSNVDCSLDGDWETANYWLYLQLYKTRVCTIDDVQKRLSAVEKHLKKLTQVPLGATANTSLKTVAVDDDPVVYLKDPIRDNWVRLVTDITLFPLCDYLYERRVITEHEMENIRPYCGHGIANSRHDFLVILSRKRIRKSVLSEAFVGSEQKELLQLLLPDTT